MSESLPPLPPLPAPTARLPIRTPRRSGGWLSLVIHLILLLVLVEATRNNIWWDPPNSDTPLQQAGGGGGGRVVDMIALPEASKPKETVPKVVPPPPPPVPVPIVTPTVIPPPVPTPPVDSVPKPSGAVTPGSGGGSGGQTGTGSGPGSGPGTGPGTGGPGIAHPDSLHTPARAPEPRQMNLIPYDYPATMHGFTIQVTFFVAADGRVDKVVFSDDFPDRAYGKRLEVVMKGYRFRPARSPAGQPVPGQYILSITF